MRLVNILMGKCILNEGMINDLNYAMNMLYMYDEAFAL